MEKYIMSLDEMVVLLCAELCGRYPFMNEDYRAQVPVAVGALKPLLCEQEYRERLDWLLADAIEDTRTGRTDAEIENFIRDAKQRRADAAAK
jgi:hypothetical protein